MGTSAVHSIMSMLHTFVPHMLHMLPRIASCISAAQGSMPSGSCVNASCVWSGQTVVTSSPSPLLDPISLTWVMFMEQYLGPHMEQKWAVLAGSCVPAATTHGAIVNHRWCPAQHGGHNAVQRRVAGDSIFA
jgi:hypothetical protein